MISDEEVAERHRDVGDKLLVSSTLRRCFAGEDLAPPSVGVAVEAQLRMLLGHPPEACELLGSAIDRLADAFPADVQPLDTT